MRFVAFSTFIIDYLREKKIFAKSASLSESELSEAVESVSHSALLLFSWRWNQYSKTTCFIRIVKEVKEITIHTYVGT